MRPTTDPTAGTTQDREDRTHNDKHNPDRPQNGDLGDKSDDK